MKKALQTVFLTLPAILIAAPAAAGIVDLPRYPAVSPDGTVIVFSWRGDLWKTPVAGGAAVRLTSHPANEGRTAFTPDGAKIVFESDREGGRNLFIMNADGSGMKQLTYGDYAATLCSTGLDGNGRPVAYFDASRENDLYRGARPYMVSLEGGTVERVNNAYGSHPVARADGSAIVFERGGSDWARRGYQGPDNRNVWMWKRGGNEFTQLTDFKGNDGFAWLVGDDLVYMTDRGNGKSLNVWRRPVGAARSEGGRQLTNFEDDVRELVVSADGKTAVFAVWDALYRLDLTDPNAQPIKLTIMGSEDTQDREQTRNMGREVTEAQLSPDGKSMALVAYGDVYVKGVDERSPFVRVTSSPWRERDIVWMPDGSKLLFSSDQDGNDSIYEASVVQTRGELRGAFKDKLHPKKEEPKKEEKKEEAKKEEAKEEPKTEEAKPAEEKPAEAKSAETKPADGKQKEKADKPAEKDQGARWADAMRVEVKPLLATPASERSPSPSPDGKQLAYRKEQNSLVVRDLSTNEERVVRTGFDTGIEWRWSPDGRYFAIEQSDENFNSDIWVVPTDGSKPAVNVSRHPDNDGSPRWSSDGKVMSFVSSRVNNESDVYLVFLDRELEGMSRFELDQYFKDAGEAAKKKAAERTAKKKKDDPKAEAKAEAKTGAKSDDATKTEAKSDAPKTEAPRPLDLDDAYLRLRRLTTMPGNEGNLELTPAGDRVYFSAQDQGGGLFSMAWSGGEAKKLAATGGIQQMMPDGAKMIVVARTGGSVVNLPGGDAKPVEFSDTVEIDLAAQSRQKFLEAARILGYLFYSNNMNGVDWPAASAKWAQLASAARTDEEFDYVANRFLGELNASHLGVRSPREGAGAPRPATGRLGARTRPVENGFEVVEILPQSPLQRSATPLAVGDVITAVNGTKVGPTTTMEQALFNTVGRETILSVQRKVPVDAGAPGAPDSPDSPTAPAAPTPPTDPAAPATPPAEPTNGPHNGSNGSSAGNDPAANFNTLELDAIVIPVSAGEQARLAYESTQLKNRAIVEKISNGRIGYIHVQGMDQPSLDEYERDLYAAAASKEGLIIDVRNNGGGWTADRLLSSIMVSPHAYTVPRGGDMERRWDYPVDRLFIQRYTQPMNLLANEKSFSNAEITAHAFKTLKRGTLVGQQTYGGVISTGSASLIDGTTVRTPFRGWYLPDGTNMELHGAVPDLIVEQTPQDESADKDAQLEAAVQDLMKRLGK